MSNLYAQDYFPFGSVMQGRSYNNDKYRFGFNGKEKEDGIGDGYDYGARISDNRLGRWLSLDPVINPSWSSYTLLKNSPICMIDPTGKTDFYNTAGEWIGTDGKLDDSRKIITNLVIEKSMIKLSRKGKNYTEKLPDNDVVLVPSNLIIKATLDVYKSMQEPINGNESTSGKHEASTAIINKDVNGVTTLVQTDVVVGTELLKPPSRQNVRMEKNGFAYTVGVDVPEQAKKGSKVLIHGHPTAVETASFDGRDLVVSAAADKPSPKDIDEFRNHDLNIIVGATGYAEYGEPIPKTDARGNPIPNSSQNVITEREHAAHFFDNKGKPLYDIAVKALENLNDGTHKEDNKLHGSYEKKKAKKDAKKARTSK